MATNEPNCPNPGQSAQVQQQERATAGHRRPKNARRSFFADLAHGQMRMRSGFLVEHDSEIFRQSEQDGGKAEADDIERTIKEATQSKGARPE